ncbi:hypothetical protein Q5752_001107 [Cryptotrichosporon argae]
MAATLMQHPSMDRTASYERPRSSASFYEPPQQPPSHPQHPSYAHSRQNSAASSSSPFPPASYGQPLPSFPSFYPPANQMYGLGQPQAWSTTALPASAFYAPNFFPPGPIFPPGFQQSHPDFNGSWNGPYSMRMGPGAGTPPPRQEYTEYIEPRRRTSSGPQSGTASQPAQLHQPYEPRALGAGTTFAGAGTGAKAIATQQLAFHPYKRGPAHRTSRENIREGASGPRITSNPTERAAVVVSPAPSSSSRAADLQSHRRSLSIDSTVPPLALPVPPAAPQTKALPRPAPKVTSPAPRVDDMAPPPKLQESRRPSPSSARSGGERASSPTREPARPSASRSSSGSGSPSPSSPRIATPLTTSSNANAMTSPIVASARPSPLSQATGATSPDPVEKKGLKGRLKRALDKEKREKAGSPAPGKHTPHPPPRSTPIQQPAADAPLSAPNAPFANPQAMGSDVSLAATDRTAAAPPSEAGKSKRSMFRMKNMSTDNISLSSTVSSASMMIRKMGSIGKLARRNSLMGISKIFKDKPKDEDAALPEREGKKKKDKKGRKGEAAPASVSHATVESLTLDDDEDRALAGLSPAAKLARQHTLRSRAEQARRDSEQAANAPRGMPSFASVVAGTHGIAVPPGSELARPSTRTEVVRVQGRPGTVVHAVAVSEHEYDSADDTSDGETLDGVTRDMANANMGEREYGDDESFREQWGNAWIDRDAVPKKGILKVAVSSEDLENKANRQRSNSTNATIHAPVAHVHAHVRHLPSPAKIDGPRPVDSPEAENAASSLGLMTNGAMQSAAAADAYDPLSPNFSPFDSDLERATLPYANAAYNTSAPALVLPAGLQGSHKPLTARSMTAPARRLAWAPECAVYSTYDAGTYDRRSEPATCNRLTPELALAIKQELNAFKLEMSVHPSSRAYTQYFA